MKKIVSAVLAGVLLFTASGISAQKSAAVIEETNVASGENIRGIIDSGHPVVITFSDALHETYNSAANAYLNNVQMNSQKLNFSISGNVLTLDFADGVIKPGIDYTLDLIGLYDADGDSMTKKTIKFSGAGEDKITENWKLNKGSCEKPDLLLFDGRVTGTVRGGISVRNMGFSEKTYGVRLVSKKGDVIVSSTDIVSQKVASGETKEIFCELAVTDKEDVYLHVVNENGQDIKEAVKITTESVPESAMLLDEYWGDSFVETYTTEVGGALKQVNYVPQSGWVFDFNKEAQSTVTYANNDYFIFRDKDTQSSVTGTKKFLSNQHGIVTLDFEIGANAVLNGTEVAVTGYKDTSLTEIVKVRIANGKLYAYNGKAETELSSFNGNSATWHAFRTQINMDTKTFDMYYNSALVLKNADFYDLSDTLSAFSVKTSKELTGDFYLRYLYAHKGFLAYDKFINTADTTVPEYWNPSGVVSIAEVKGGRSNDTDSLKLGSDSDTGSGSVYYEYGNVKDDIQTYFKFLPSGKGHFGIYLKGKNGYYVFQFDIYQKSMYFDGKKISEDIADNVWHEGKFVFDKESNTIEFYLDDRKLASKVFAFSDSVLGIRFEGTGGQILDDLIISKIDKTTTVINESQIPEKDDIDVHMIVYPMWREGSHFGWDRIGGYPERTPYLGYFDSGNIEATNMQIKWLLEHGVDAMIIPFSRATGNIGQKVKFSNREETLHNGYFNSPYRDKIKFGILYSGISRSSLASIYDFKNNIVPYWIEHYFKHDNYVTTGSGQAVLYMYTQSSFYDVIKEIIVQQTTGISRNDRINEYKKAGKSQSDAEGLADKDINSIAKGIGTDIENAVKDCFSYLEEKVMEIKNPDGTSKYTGLYTVFVDDPTDTESYALAESIGADAVFNYGDPQNAAYEASQRKRYNDAKRARDNSGTEVDFVPSGYMGYQRHPWDGGTSGGFCDPDGLERVLREIKEDITAGKVSPEKLVTLGCWDEFGEGHFFMPSEVQGFGYLDAVRNVFGDLTPHTDVKPSSLEKRRFGWLYQNDGTAYRSFPWNDEEEAVNNVTKGWYFSDYTNADITGNASSGFKIGDSGWTVYNAASCSIENGALKIVDQNNGNAPILDYGYNDSSNQQYTDLITTDCKKIVVNMDSNWEDAKGQYGLIYFATEYTRGDLGYKFMQSDSSGSCIVSPFRWNIFQNSIQEADLINNVYWEKTARVQKIRYWPAYYGANTSGGAETLTIYLYNIEFLGEIAQ